MVAALARKSGLLIHRSGDRVKAVRRGNGLIEGYLLVWDKPDLEGEYFTRGVTDLRLDWYGGNLPVLYHHGLDGDAGLDQIGRFKALREDDHGVWVQAQLDLANKYAADVYGVVDSGAAVAGWSSGSVDHLVKIAPHRQILVWPVIEGSVTFTPAMPAATTVRALKSIVKDQSFSEQLRGLRARVAARSDGANFTYEEGSDTMASRKTIAFVRATLKSAGLKATDEQIEAVASDVEEEAIMSDLEDPALMSDLDDEAIMSDLEDPALMSDLDDEAIMSDLEDPALMSDFEDEAIMSDLEDPALMSDFEDEAIMSDDEYIEPVASRSRRAKMIAAKRRRAKMLAAAKNRSTKSLGSDDLGEVAALLRQQNQMLHAQNRRIKALEMSEAPGEQGVGRGYKSLKVTRDAADQPHAYTNAFKSYLRFGEMRLDDDQRRALYAHGAMDSNMNKVGIKAYNTGSATSVGFAVPEDFVAELNKNIAAHAQLIQDCKSRTTTSDTVTQPDLRTTDARRAYPGSVSWPGEQPADREASAAEEFQLGLLQIPVHVMLVNYLSSRSALEDTAFDLQAEINVAFAEQTATEWDQLVWSGSGQGKIKGIVTEDAVVGTKSLGVETVGGYIPSGKAGSLEDADAIIKMFSHMPAQRKSKAKWYMNSNTHDVISRLKDANGRYLFSEDDRGLIGPPAMTLRGRPIVLVEFAPNIAAGAYPLGFWDLSVGYQVVKRVEFSVQRFDDSAVAVRDQVLFMGRARIGGQVIQPAAFKTMKIAAS